MQQMNHLQGSPISHHPFHPIDMSNMEELLMQHQIPNAMAHLPASYLPEPGFSLSDSETPRKKRGTNSIVKRRPYTRLACFTCKEKHQKCDGGSPCSNCSSKGVECRYRLERNRRRDEGDIRDEIDQLHIKIEQWKTKYLMLKKFVGLLKSSFIFLLNS